MNNIGGRIARNTLIQFAGKGITTVVGLVLLALLTRKLGVASYGDYVTILAFSQFFAIFADFGINVYALKRLSTPTEDEHIMASEALGLRVVTVTGIMTIGGLIGLFFPYSHLVKEGIFIGLFSMLIQTINSYYVTILQARLEMKYASISEIVGRVITLALSAGFVIISHNVLWVVGAQAIGSAFNMALTLMYARRFVKVGISWNTKAWGPILREAIPISISSVLGYLYFKVDTVMLSVVHLSGGRLNAVEVGIYGSAYKVLEILLLIPAIFLGTIFPVMSHFLNTKDPRVNKLLVASLEVMGMFSFPATVVLIFAAPQVILFVAGKNFLAAAVPLRILSLAVLLNYFSAVFNYTALTLNKQVALIKIYVCALIFNVAANAILIPRYSYVAAAWTTFATEIIVLILPFIVCQRALHFKIEFGRLSRAALAGLSLAVVLWFARNSALWVVLLLTATVYPVMLVLLRGFNREDFQLLLKS